MVTTDERQRFDHSHLLGVLRSRKKSVSAFAREMGISKTAMDKKISGKTPWKDHEIKSACAILGITSAKEVIESFFTLASLQTQTNA